MIKFYFSGAPNPTKVALFLEEDGPCLRGDPRRHEEGRPVQGRLPQGQSQLQGAGDRRRRRDGLRLQCDSLDLAEKTGKFLPPNTPANRGELLSWLMFVATGVGPFSGQSVLPAPHAREDRLRGQSRYTFEAMRHYAILNERLAKHRYVVADTYSIVDMDVWGWARMVPYILSKDSWDKLPHLKRLVDEIEARPAAQRATQLKDRFTFKAEMDEEARRNMFRHLAGAKG